MTNEATRILVVDDEPNIREMLQRGLTRAGYQCTGAESADSAAERLEQQEWSLVLLDINMPGKSGMDLLDHIRLPPPSSEIDSYPAGR